MRAFVRGVVVIATQKVVSNVVRDRVAQFFLFVLPLGIAVVVGGAGASAGHVSLSAVRPADPATAAALERAAAASPSLRVRWIDDADEARRLLARQEVAAMLVIETGGDGRQQADLWVDQGRLDPGLVSGPVMGLLSAVSRQLDGSRLALDLFALDGPSAVGDATAVTPRRVVLDTGPATTLGGFRFAAAGNFALFAFLTTFGTAVALLNDRNEGQLQRMLTAPIPRGAIVGGHLVARVLVGVVQVTFVVAASSLLFDVEWGSLALVAALAAPFVVMSAALGLVAATWYRSNEQASVMTGLIGFPAAMLGGCFWPLAVVDPTLRTIGHLVPHAWLVDGLLAVGGGARLADVGTELAVLFAAAALALGACLWRVPYFLTAHPVRNST